jgi:hypothetical protein
MTSAHAETVIAPKRLTRQARRERENSLSRGDDFRADASGRQRKKREAFAQEQADAMADYRSFYHFEIR